MGKNIILCSDGTGNKGGYGADTNVFKLYNAVDIHCPKTQITFYDDGVGTNTNKYIRAVTGAFGVGFGKNIRDLYAFLARNYDEGDEIYLFGFSRGAATVRAFAGMVQECGLLDINGKFCKTNGDFDELKFKFRVEEAFEAYEKIKTKKSVAAEFKKSFAFKHEIFAPDGNLKIKMIGVWDTVSALGFPQDWSRTVDWFFRGFDKLTDWWLPHNFYNYQLNYSVENVHHAIAIDDERKTFHPKIWNEKCKECCVEERQNPTKDGKSRKCTHNFHRPQKIEQVWFAGVHSNVGGGYPRAGLSLVALNWMLERAWNHGHGIEFKKGFRDQVKADANVYGKLYDSRDGFAIYYRYAPRNIDELCDCRIVGPVKIHERVISRMKGRILGYAPGFLPEKIEVMETSLTSASKPITWVHDQSQIDRWVRCRKGLYRIFVEATLVLIATSIWFWKFPVVQKFPGKPIAFFDLFSLDKWDSGFEWLYGVLSWVARHVADFLTYILPEFIEPFVIFALLVKPEVSVFILIAGFWIYFIREFLRVNTQKACENVREQFLKEYEKLYGGD